MLAAATTALARDGMAAATLGRIAAEAGVDKAMILYYFGSRDALLAQVVKWLGKQVVEQAEAAFVHAPSVLHPNPMADIGIDAMWTNFLAIPELPRAYFTLSAGSRDEEVQSALREVETAVVDIIHQQVKAVEAEGYRLLDDRNGFVTLMFGSIRGLILDWVENGDSEQLRSARDQFKAVAASRFVVLEGPTVP